LNSGVADVVLQPDGPYSHLLVVLKLFV